MSNFIYYEKLEDYEEQVKKAKLCDKKDKEIKRLKEEYMTLQNASDEVEEEKDKEIERLNNIINEFEEWLNAKYEEMHDIWYVKVLIKLKELKGVEKSENNKY